MRENPNTETAVIVMDLMIRSVIIWSTGKWSGLGVSDVYGRNMLISSENIQMKSLYVMHCLARQIRDTVYRGPVKWRFVGIHMSRNK